MTCILISIVFAFGSGFMYGWLFGASATEDAWIDRTAALTSKGGEG